MTSRLLIWLLSAGAITLALGPLAHYGESAASAIVVETPHHHSSAPRPVLATSLQLAVSHGVAFTLHVTNTSDSHVEINFPDGQTHDFVVLDSTGHQVWRWSNGHLFTQTLQNKLLNAKESVTYEEHWQPAGRHGRFTAVAILKSSNHPVEERVQFVLP
ncbi:MAG TPA: BsuPI-related putative proteinase inhibitor [Gemmatimonadaceae bacterium]|nr:BsuPI-related putative proteinase inhibitor [Gemmatimonadaceae bacterium]